MSRSGKHRPERVATLIQETLGVKLTTDVKDPRVGFVTITSVDVSPDCTHATVHVSVLGEEEDKQKAMEGLESAKGYLRSHLAQALSLRVTPELHFRLDRGLEHAARIDEILSKIKNEEQS
jgi:ribosome-binding factor A